jgi:hypothetical protein
MNEIKTAVYAYWAKPFLEKNIYSNFQRKNDLLVSLKLSVEQSRKFFDKIVFFGDREAITQICKIIEFDEIYDDLEELNEKNIPSYFYSSAKALACSKMKEPFVLLENDFILWEIPEDSNLLSSSLIIEDWHETPNEYLNEFDSMKRNSLDTRPRWYKLAKGNFKIPSKGIYGGTNVKFITEHAIEIVRLIYNENNLNVFQSNGSHKTFKNTHKIYDLWYCGAKIDSQKLEPFAIRYSDVKYTHLMSDKKNQDDVSVKLYKRMKKELPDFMKKIENQENKIYDPLASYDYFTEKTTGIPNISCGAKKLSFVMALMNRFHQIEQTLLKNLEDNWKDRDDVEFILMDINSKDGFREWLQSQNLEKYTECDYLRCYETDILSEWHASIGKNTATHQAKGTIVVTLDCDNFTGYRGGKFVIDHFEKNDYNCVIHQFDWNPKNGNFGRIALTKKKFDEIGGYDQSLLPMGYQDWDIIKRAEASGCKYVNPTDALFNRAIENEGGKELSMANQKDDHKKMGWTEMNRINKLKCHINLYQNKLLANDGYYGIRSNVRQIL